MNYLFDTNALLIWMKNETARKKIEASYNPFDSINTALISVVTLGEIEAIALKNSWGTERIEKVELLLDKLVVLDINSADVLGRYAQIDAYSQRRLEHHPLNTTARNMGKNDLWIAATASVSNSKLLTSDKDFLHLDTVFLDLIYIDLNKAH